MIRMFLEIVKKKKKKNIKRERERRRYSFEEGSNAGERTYVSEPGDKPMDNVINPYKLLI